MTTDFKPIVTESEIHIYMCVCIYTLYLTLCNPMNCSPPGSSVHGVSPGNRYVYFIYISKLNIYRFCSAISSDAGFCEVKHSKSKLAWPSAYTIRCVYPFYLAVWPGCWFVSVKFRFSVSLVIQSPKWRLTRDTGVRLYIFFLNSFCST